MENANTWTRNMEPIMQRRSFLVRSLAALGGLTGAGLAGSGAVQAQPIRRRQLLLQHMPIAGYQYHAGPTVWPQLAPGQAVRLVREPDNRHDPRAVRVDWQGHTLGYLPRRDNAAVAQLLDRTQPLDARIRALHDVPDPWGRIELDVLLRV
jgi:hypothetical protein